LHFCLLHNQHPALAAQQATSRAQFMRARILGYLSMSMLVIAVWVHPPRDADSPDYFALEARVIAD
jgi:hypothetical protein